MILMASRALAACARSADDYVHVYSRVLANVGQPVILHWLGEMFDPALAGYWLGATSADAIPITRVRWTSARASSPRTASKVDGIKISLLDEQKEIALRADCRAGVRMYTGDDFNFAALIGGDAQRPLRRAAGHLRCDRPCCVAQRCRRLRAATARDSTRFSRRRCRCRATSLRRRRGSTRRAWCSWRGSMDTRRISRWSTASRVRAVVSSRPALPARRRARPVARIPTLRAARMRTLLALTASKADDARDSRREARAELPDPRCCRSTRPPCARSGRCPTPSQACAARHTRHFALARPGRRGRARRHGAANSRRRPDRHGACRGGMFPAPDREGRRAAHDDNRRAVDEALTLGARCLVLVVGGLPKDRGGQIVSRDLAGAREMVRDGLGSAVRIRARRGHATRDRAAASDVRRRPRLREHDGAGQRAVRRVGPRRHRWPRPRR